MLLQRKIKGVSAQKLVQWLTDINICDITTVNEENLPIPAKEVHGQPHFCEPKSETESSVLGNVPGQTRLYIDLKSLCCLCCMYPGFHTAIPWIQMPGECPDQKTCTQTCSLTLTSFTEDQTQPRNPEPSSIETLDLHRRFIYMKDINYAELLSSFTMYISTKGCGEESSNKMGPHCGYMTLENTETLFTSCICCHETTSYILCTCNILKTFSQNNSRLISIQSLHGNELFHLQWSDLSGKSQLLPRDHLDVSPWWNDTFYEENTCALTETMDLVEQTILNTNLAKKTAEILPSSSTHSAQYTYTGWDWVFRGCVFASMVTFTVTLIQCCYVRCALRSLCKATHFVPSPCSCQLHKDCRSRPGMGYGLNWN
uniref:Uncharacterized protein n=1 Tax=Astyanax mexicanus TaxID=7994 RepID=A0A3B1JBR7_ASTMX